MKDNEEIQDKLSELPKYSLRNEQKKRILLEINAGQDLTKKKTFLKPFLASLASLALLFILVISEFDLNSLGFINQSEHKQTQFTSEVGKKFILLDTKQEAIGIEDNVALLNTFNNFVAEDKRRVSKLMIFYWGNESELVGKNYRVEAMNMDGEKFTMSEGELYYGLNSEDAHTLTSFSPFPTEGKWHLSFYVENKLHGSFSIDVLPPFPKTDQYTLMDSPHEIGIGKKVSITIESTGENIEEIDVKLINDEGIVVYEAIFKQEALNFDSITNEPIYLFNGFLEFPDKGVWTLMIDNEITQSFHN